MMTNRNYRLFTSLVAALTLATSSAQTAPEVPRLVVSILIDQLRSDYMEAFYPLYGERGFKRLFKESRMYTQAEYPFRNPDRASATACIYSGASPYDNGIVGAMWLSRESLRPIYCVDDRAYSGNLTAEYTSPKHLVVSTIVDELKVATEGKALAYAISPYRESAIFSGGHTADGVFWLNDASGQWCSSSYYGEYPKWAVNYDHYKSLGSRISDIEWRPMNDLVGNFNYFVSGGIKEPFSHSFSGHRKFREFKASGCVNEEVNRFAMHCMQNTTLGMDAVTDFLSVMYYAGNYDQKPISETPIELQDTYVRLDKDLGELMDAVERKVGVGKVLFVISSTGYAEHETSDLTKYRIPTGTFSMFRSASLLNMYLMAVYGPGQYVEAKYGAQIYLNHKLIEDKQLNMTELLERCQSFLMQMSGVKDVYTSQSLTLGAWTPGISRIRNGYHPQCSGDILVDVAPGWKLVDEESGYTHVARESYVGFPLFFIGCNVEPMIIESPVTVDCVAPTLARMMRIRAPNACAVAPLSGLR